MLRSIPNKPKLVVTEGPCPTKIMVLYQDESVVIGHHEYQTENGTFGACLFVAWKDHTGRVLREDIIDTAQHMEFGHTDLNSEKRVVEVHFRAYVNVWNNTKKCLEERTPWSGVLEIALVRFSEHQHVY